MEAVMIEQSVITSAPRKRVWRAITKPANLSKWLAPLSVQFDNLAVGEVVTFTYEGGSNKGSIAIVEPIERFAFRWKAHPQYEIQTLVSFSLKELDEGTQITITETGFEALPTEARQARIDLNTRGWQQVLKSIAVDLSEDDDR